MENNVVTLATAQRLKAAGFSGRGVAMWWNIGVSDTTLKRGASPSFDTVEQYPAPTAQELADELPTLRDGEKGTYSRTVHMSPVGTGWQACYSLNSKSPHHHWLDVLERVDGTTLAEALAALWLALREGQVR